MEYIDLHVHSTASDGTFTPTELIQYACEKNLYAIALTDHDTVSGIDEALKACEGKDIKLIPGVELSTEYNKKDIHIVGLFLDYKNPKLVSRLDELKLLRQNRNQKICDLMRQDGINISMEQLSERFKDSILTRAHFARFLLENNYVTSTEEAFSKYLSEGCNCYVPKVMLSPLEAIKVIKDANGIPILAHPMLYNLTDEQLDNLVKYFKENGLEAIEAIYTLNSPKEEAKTIALAKKYNLKISGGSDFHGKNKPLTDLGSGINNNIAVPKTILEQLIKN